MGRHSHSGADLGDTAEVYRATGEALSTWVVDDAVQERIHNFINVNWRNSAKSNHGGYPFAKEHQFGAVSSFGAAKVTVGRDRFSLWAEDLLAREVLVSLSTGHLRLSQFAERSSDDTEGDTIAKTGRRYAEQIHRGVTSGTAHDDQEAAGCSSAANAFAPDEQVRDVRRQVREQLTFAVGQQASGQIWSQELRKKGVALVEQWEQEAQVRQDFDWCQEMLAATCRAVSEVAALSSLDVAAAALLHVTRQVNPAKVNEIRQRAQQDNANFNRQVESGLKDLAAVDDDLTGDSPQIRDAAEKVAKGVAYRWRGLRLRAAADTMEAAGEQVFGAVRRAVLAARQEVGIALGEDTVKAWPTGVDDIAKRYLPSTVELPLEGHDAWPGLLGDLCAEARTVEVPYGSLSTDALRYRLIAGDSDMQPLVRPGMHHRWQPGQHADVMCHAGADDIEERVRQWTRRPGSKFNRVVSEGLRSYLAEADQTTSKRRIDHSQRMEVFREQVGNAKQAADPLMRIDRDVYAVTNGNPLEPFLTVCSQFPFGDGHPAEEPSPVHRRRSVLQGERAGHVLDTGLVIHQQPHVPDGGSVLHRARNRRAPGEHRTRPAVVGVLDVAPVEDSRSIRPAAQRGTDLDRVGVRGGSALWLHHRRPEHSDTDHRGAGRSLVPLAAADHIASHRRLASRAARGVLLDVRLDRQRRYEGL